MEVGAFSILHAETGDKAAKPGVVPGVPICRSSGAQVMMKGSLHTGEVMKAAMQRDTGLRTARRIRR